MMDACQTAEAFMPIYNHRNVSETHCSDLQCHFHKLDQVAASPQSCSCYRPKHARMRIQAAHVVGDWLSMTLPRAVKCSAVQGISPGGL